MTELRFYWARSFPWLLIAREVEPFTWRYVWPYKGSYEVIMPPGKKVFL